MLGINRLIYNALRAAVHDRQKAQYGGKSPGSQLLDGADAHAYALRHVLVAAGHLLRQPPQASALQVADAVIRRSPGAPAFNRHQMCFADVTYVVIVTVLYRTLKRRKGAYSKPCICQREIWATRTLQQAG